MVEPMHTPPPRSLQRRKSRPQPVRLQRRPQAPWSPAPAPEPSRSDSDSAVPAPHNTVPSPSPPPSPPAAFPPPPPPHKARVEATSAPVRVPEVTTPPSPLGGADRPFKIVFLGHETLSGKGTLFQTLTVASEHHHHPPNTTTTTTTTPIPSRPSVHVACHLPTSSESSALYPITVLDVDSARVVDPQQPGATQAPETVVELWMPKGSKDLSFDFVASTFPNTHIFILVFNIASMESLNYIKDLYDTDVARYLREHPDNSCVVYFVGTNAEARSVGNGTNDIPSTRQAVDIAKACHVTRYIEVLSQSATHSYDVLMQALRQATQQVAHSSMIYNMPARSAALRRFALPPPTGQFNYLHGTFEVARHLGCTYLWGVVTQGTVTIQDCTHVYDRSIPAPALPAGGTLGIIAVMRCRYVSPITVFDIPHVTQLKIEGHWAGEQSSFFIRSLPHEQDIVYYYALRRDNGHMTAQDIVPSMLAQYSPEYGIPCPGDDDDAGMSTGSGSGSGAMALWIAGVRPGHFLSAYQRIPLLARVDKPIVVATKGNRNIVILNQVPGVDYHYTLDGTLPSPASPVFLPDQTRVPSEVDSGDVTIRVRGFPRPLRSSEVTTVVWQAGGSDADRDDGR